MSYTPEIPNVISAANSTTALLTGGATFTGAWEEVIDYTTVASSILGSIATDGTLYFDLSTDGGSTFTSVPSTIGDATFAVPRILNVVETHVRIRYVNGTTAQTGTFNIQTKYSNGQELALLSSVDGFINGETPTQVVRSVSTGISPSGSYVNIKTDGQAFTSTALLADAAVYDSGILSLDGYSQVQTEVEASHDGQLDFMFYEDAGGVNLVRSLTIPYVATSGFQIFAAPAFGYYVRYKFTNNSGSVQTEFYYTTKFITKSISAQVLAKNGFVSPNMTANLVRVSSEPNSDRNIGIIGGQESKRKFGVNESVSSSALETVWSYGADWIPNQVKNEKLRVKSGGNANDTGVTGGSGARTIEVTFLDESLLEVTETLTLAGAAASAATTANCFRLISAKVITVGTYHTSNIAAIVLELTGGNIMGNIKAGVGTSEQAILTVPSNKRVFVTEIFLSVGQGDSADVKMFTVDDASDVTVAVSAKREEWGVEDYSGAAMFKFDTHLKFEASSEVWFEAQRITGSGTARVSVDFNYYTVEI